MSCDVDVMERAPLDALEQGHLRALAGRLEQAGYEERAVCQLLGLREIYQIHGGTSVRTFRRVIEDNPLAHLTAFWLLGHPRELGVLERLMGAETVAVLSRLALIDRGEWGMKACAHLFPCLGRYLFLDLMSYAGNLKYQVYWLGGDSVALARMAPRSAVRRSLDLCTGSGVHAVLNAAHSQESWGVDINPRALEYCRINAILNAARCTFVRGSLYEPVPEGRFGLITANPPFVPTPRGDLAFYRPGGETGEAITAGIVGGLAERLEVGGTLALVSECPTIRGTHPLDRVEKWLGGGEGWGLGQIKLGHSDRESMVAGHVTPRSRAGDEAYRQEYESWLDSYEEHGIVGTDLAMTFVRRLAPGRPGWRAEWVTNLPPSSVSDRVETWLDVQERFSARAEDWEWRPSWGPISRLMVEARSGEGLAFFREMTWRTSGMYVEPESAFLLRAVDGRKTARDLLESFAGQYGRSLDQARSEVWRRLNLLGGQMLLG